MNYLHQPRRNRLWTLPISMGDYYSMPLNARVSLDIPFGIATTGATVGSVIANTPVTGSAVEPAFGLASTSLVNAQGFAVKPSAVTMSIANPCVVTYNSHGLANGQVIRFTTTGALPTGVTSYTNYYVINQTLNTFEFSPNSYGVAIITYGTQSGTHSLYYLI